MQRESYYAIYCDDEEPSSMPVKRVAYDWTTKKKISQQLSNKRSGTYWQALFELVEILASKDATPPQRVTLFSWRDEPHHLAAAREQYAWRSVIEDIKNSDLRGECAPAIGGEEMLALVSDKPLMLKIAGEVTNCLMHSYNLSHRLTFTSSP